MPCNKLLPKNAGLDYYISLIAQELAGSADFDKMVGNEGLEPPTFCV